MFVFNWLALPAVSTSLLRAEASLTCRRARWAAGRLCLVRRAEDAAFSGALMQGLLHALDPRATVLAMALGPLMGW